MTGQSAFAGQESFRDCSGRSRTPFLEDRPAHIRRRLLLQSGCTGQTGPDKSCMSPDASLQVLSAEGGWDQEAQCGEHLQACAAAMPCHAHTSFASCGDVSCQVLCDEFELELAMARANQEYEGTQLNYDQEQCAWVLEYCEQRTVPGLRGIAWRADVRAWRITWRRNGVRLYQLTLREGCKFLARCHGQALRSWRRWFGSRGWCSCRTPRPRRGRSTASMPRSHRPRHGPVLFSQIAPRQKSKAGGSLRG